MKRTRSNLNEEYLRGIPEHVLRTATKKYIDELKQHMFRYVLANKSSTAIEQRQSIAAVELVAEDLEEKANALLEDALFQFTRQT